MLPAWLPGDAWDGYLAMRKQKKKTDDSRSNDSDVEHTGKADAARRGFSASAESERGSRVCWGIPRFCLLSRSERLGGQENTAGTYKQVNRPQLGGLGGKMHAANVESSDRLKRVVSLLSDGMPRTTMQVNQRSRLKAGSGPQKLRITCLTFTRFTIGRPKIFGRSMPNSPTSAQTIFMSTCTKRDCRFIRRGFVSPTETISAEAYGCFT